MHYNYVSTKLPLTIYNSMSFKFVFFIIYINHVISCIKLKINDCMMKFHHNEIFNNLNTSLKLDVAFVIERKNYVKIQPLSVIN